MANNLTLAEWQAAYQQNPDKVRRQIQTLLRLYWDDPEKLNAVKQIWLALVTPEAEASEQLK